MIILYKMLFIKGRSNEKRNVLPTRTSFFISIAKKLKAWRSSKLNFSSTCVIADDSHVKIVWLHVAVFSEHDTLQF